jgi:hypothetical protein
LRLVEERKLDLKKIKASVVANKVKADDPQIMTMDPSRMDAIAKEFLEMQRME